MRKLILILFILLSCGSLANSGMVSFPGGGVPSAGYACASYYNSANVLFSWDGGLTDNKDGCSAAGVKADGTLTGGDIGTYQGRTALRVDAASEHISFVNTGGLYADMDESQTICVGAWLTGIPVANTSFYKAYSGDDTNVIEMYQLATGKLGVRWVGNSTLDTRYHTTSTGTGAWKVLKISHQTAGDPYIGVYNGATYEYQQPIIDAATAELSTMFLGNQRVTSPAGSVVYISDFAVLSGFHTACPF